MTEHSLWRFSRALYRAINERQREDLEALIDEDVEWVIHGPIMFPFLGARRGKAAVLEVIRQIADNVRVHRFDRESIMLGVDSAASMMRYSLTALDSNKPISLRLAHFAQFKAGRLTSIRVLVDTFDLVEQALAARGARFHFTGVRIQPGKPAVFGELPPRTAGGAPLPFFGLPGNPVSTMVTFLLSAAPVLRALSGLLPIRQGEVRFRGETVTGMRPDQLVQRRTAHVPEGRRLFADLTVEQNLLLGAISRSDKAALRRDLEHVYDLFPRLRERRGQAAGSMSGGEQQMCAIGRGIMSAPLLLMVDEMSLGLAPVLVEQLMGALASLRDDGVTVLLVEQDVEIALEGADRGYVMETGQISASGSAADLLNDPRIRSAYLGL